MNLKNYKCSICNRQNVKLWRPYFDKGPLICAVCAERNQAQVDYDEVAWREDTNGEYIGDFTDRKLPLPRWTIDSNGKIPSLLGPGPKGAPEKRTDKLIVDLSKNFSEYQSDKPTTMVPACQDEDGEFWSYSHIPDKTYKEWEALPTR